MREIQAVLWSSREAMGDSNWPGLSVGALVVEIETDLEFIQEYLNLGKHTFLFTFLCHNL